ncbi:MAG TPA: hypothetical protein VGN36_09545, partial [Sphingorhabdus sp.]|nr:hypothetical protein [Sphingorhabdus sp.]
MGIANFAMHKAVAESGHPFVEDTKHYFGRHFSPYGSYAIELALLIGAMWFAQQGSIIIALLYWIYTGMNGLATWLLLSRKM